MGLPDATHIVVLISPKKKVSVKSFFWIAINFRGHKEEVGELAKKKGKKFQQKNDTAGVKIVTSVFAGVSVVTSVLFRLAYFVGLNKI